MPAGTQFRAAEMKQSLLLFFSAQPFRRSRESKLTRKPNFIVAPGMNAEHAQYADDPPVDRIAKNRAGNRGRMRGTPGFCPKYSRSCTLRPAFGAEGQAQQAWTLSGGSNPRFAQDPGIGAAAETTLPGMVWAGREQAPAKARPSEDMEGFFILLTFSSRPVPARRQTFFRR